MTQKTSIRGFISMLALLALSYTALTAASTESVDPFNGDADSVKALRTDVVQLARACTASDRGEALEKGGPSLDRAGHWDASVAVYANGARTHEGAATGMALDEALCDAAINAVGGASTSSATRSEQDRLLIRLRLDGGAPHSIIEFQGQGLELVGDLVPVRSLDRSDVWHTVEANKAYLLRVMHPEMHGFSKKYDIIRGGFDDRLRTIYTSSSLYSLLRVNALQTDPQVEANIEPIADFILSMQKQDAPYRGAFHYSYDLRTGEKERRFPVGTNAKILMTLAALYEKSRDSRYLEAAVAAGDWLLSLQKPDGSFPVDVAWRNGGWDTNEAFSLFYNCQVLTGLSRLYGISGAQRHLDGASKLATKLLGMVEEDGYLLRDEYRPKVESISTSWLAMSLLDYSRIDPDSNSLDIAFKCLEALLTLQMTDPDDILTYGRFSDTRATSGNGWINEVVSEMLATCQATGRTGCERLERALILTSRWLIQNTYSPQNTYHIEDPEAVIGGLIRNGREEAVRTDAVCHGVNSMVGLLRLTDREVLLH
ncbi:hypothetical protein Thimo_1902 [Thioflavicoccus mobilis 8321]|uniref:Uncharacterized protein n=1 Tax=Thioflavicoccus mobilis 8321 TaxID=765912 RepID=L0GV89_9GAMM|nr:hypothetical protein [Thioflavicoccus mobilis]AGA90668.1 hypothetical protein Thimo_1902 [Thioflavicoccus mobilis 8321]